MIDADKCLSVSLYCKNTFVHSSGSNLKELEGLLCTFLIGKIISAASPCSLRATTPHASNGNAKLLMRIRSSNALLVNLIVGSFQRIKLLHLFESSIISTVYHEYNDIKPLFLFSWDKGMKLHPITQIKQ